MNSSPKNIVTHIRSPHYLFGFISVFVGLLSSLYYSLFINRLLNHIIPFKVDYIILGLFTFLFSLLLYKAFLRLLKSRMTLNALLFSLWGMLIGGALFLWHFPNFGDNSIFFNSIFTLFIKVAAGFVFGFLSYYFISISSFLNKKQDFLLLFGVSLIFSSLYFVSNYNFGLENQTEDLPQVMRLLDKNYLSNDYFVNQSSSHISIRYFFIKFMAITAQWIGLKPAYLLIFLISTTLILFISACFTYRLFNNNIIAGIFNIFLIWLIPTPFILAGGYGILYGQALANFVCAIFLYWGIFEIIINKRNILGSFLFGVAFLFQALSASQGFAIILGGLVAVDLKNNRGWFTLEFLKKILRKYLPMLLIFTCISFFLMIPYLLNSQGYLTGLEFAKIYGYFRIPHHARPSQFLSSYAIIQTITYIAIFIGILINSKSLRDQDWLNIFLLGGGVVISILFLCSYIFVEIIPTRIFVTLVPYMKIGSIISWFGLIFISGYLAELSINRFDLTYAIVIILGGIISYFAIFVDNQVALILFTIFFVPILFKNLIRKIIIIKKFSSGKSEFLFGLFIQLLLCSVFLLSVNIYSDKPITFYIKNAIQEHPPQVDTLYGFIALETKPDAMFIAPGSIAMYIRVIPERSVVVAPKTYPANDEGLAEWYKRVFDIYGCSYGKVSMGYSLYELDDHYRHMDDDCLSIITDKYSVDYAVLYLETQTNYPIVFRDSEWKIVKLR